MADEKYVQFTVTRRQVSLKVIGRYDGESFYLRNLDNDGAIIEVEDINQEEAKKYFDTCANLERMGKAWHTINQKKKVLEGKLKE